MPLPRRYFARVPASVNFALLQSKLVVVIGLGMVGSPIAQKLARSAVGHLRFIDDDILEIENLGRHVLPVEYVDNVQPWNKAEGLAHYLAKQVEGLHTGAIPRKVDGLVRDDLLDAWLSDADLIVAATDDREAQRRIGVRALELGIPAIFPALYPQDGGGEIVLQLDHDWPCFGCWDYFRTNTEQLRGINALELAGQPVIHMSVVLCLSILDPDSVHKDVMKGDPGDPPNQVFMLDDAATLRSGPARWRDECPSCGGPGPPRTGAPPVGAHGQVLPGPTPALRSQADTPVLISLAMALVVVMIILLSVSGGGSSSKPEAATGSSEETATSTTTAESAPPPGASTSSNSNVSSTATTTTKSSPPSCGSAAACAEEGADVAAGQKPPTTQGESQSTTTTAEGSTAESTKEASSTTSGTSVATANEIQSGIEETGNSDAVAYGEGSCGPEQGQVWSVSLSAGELVKIVWGGENGSATGLDIWPPGTTEVHGSSEGRLAYASTEGENTETTFTPPMTGVYPIVIDDSCGHPGPFHFTLTTGPG
jgi:ThiF family